MTNNTIVNINNYDFIFPKLKWLVVFVPWKLVEQKEKENWTICSEQSGYIVDWEKGGLLMKKYYPRDYQFNSVGTI